MITHSETTDVISTGKAKRWRKQAVVNLREGLPYADHGAYGQDLQRIRDLEDEIKALDKIELELLGDKYGRN